MVPSSNEFPRTPWGGIVARGRESPRVSEVFDEAHRALSVCADVARRAGCRAASTYVAGSSGSLRHAAARLEEAGRWSSADAAGFDAVREGRSQVHGSSGFADTISGCLLPDGTIGTVRALVAERSLAGAVWVRPDARLPNLHVRGRVERSSEGYVFIDEQDALGACEPGARPDLGRDLVVRGGIDLTGSPALAAALQATLASGSWLHLETGVRWQIDGAGARTIVRMLGGLPSSDDLVLGRLGICVDAGTLLGIELLGWRHWPTPSVKDA